MHLGVVGVACAWRAADVDHSYIQAPPAVWYAIGIGAAIWYFSFVVLYLAKIVMYPKKVRVVRRYSRAGHGTTRVHAGMMFGVAGDVHSVASLKRNDAVKGWLCVLPNLPHTGPLCYE